MIQRKQTLWLLIAGILLFLSTILPIYIGTFNNVKETAFPRPDRNGFKYIFYIMIAFCFLAIGLFKKRNYQKQIVLALVLNWFMIGYITTYQTISDFTSGSFTIYSIFYFATPVFLILAYFGIYKDEKLIKSVNSNRLRD